MIHLKRLKVVTETTNLEHPKLIIKRGIGLYDLFESSQCRFVLSNIISISSIHMRVDLSVLEEKYE